MRKTLDVVKRLFPWRPCTEEVTGTRARPCLDFFIGRCIAPCSGACSKEEYDEVIREVILFLEGRTENVLRALRAQMAEASRNMQYERAAILRDQIRAIENVSETQVTAYARPTDEDVFGLARSDGEAEVQVLFIRGTKMIGGDHFPLDGTKGEPDAEVVNGFLKQFYESATYVPRTVLLPLEVPEKAEIEDWLSERRGSRVTLLTPKRGNKRRLIAMATDNAREALEVARLKWLTDTGKTQQALEELQEELNLPALPQRIECYDISDIMGAHPVGSMVVFIDGRPRPAEYRRFRIKTVEGANDVAMMAEVLRRRFKRAAQVSRGEGCRRQRRLGRAARPAHRRRRQGAAQRRPRRPARGGRALRTGGGSGQAARGALCEGPRRADRAAADVAGSLPGAAHPRRGAPLRRHLSSQRAAEGGHAVGARLDSGRRAEAKAGAPAEVRLGAGDTGGERR